MKILVMLMNSDLCVGALANHVGISKPAVSQHLRILRRAGLVRGEKRGYWTHYMVDRRAIFLIAEELTKLAETRQTFDTICRRINPMPPDAPEAKGVDMCRNCCQQPAELQDKPPNGSPEQIRKCHGDAKDHPCTKENGASTDK